MKETGEDMNNDKKDGGAVEEKSSPNSATMGEIMFGDMDNDEDNVDAEEENISDNTVIDEIEDLFV